VSRVCEALSFLDTDLRRLHLSKRSKNIFFPVEIYLEGFRKIAVRAVYLAALMSLFSGIIISIIEPT
jgi:hypothetical protein